MQVRSIPGVLGLISAYYGVVESQGRGTLHIHLLLWLADTPRTAIMKEQLTDKRRREKLKHYISQTVHAHAEGVTEAGCLAPNPSPSPAYNRPPNPQSPSFATNAIEAKKNAYRIIAIPRLQHQQNPPLLWLLWRLWSTLEHYYVSAPAAPAALEQPEL